MARLLKNAGQQIRYGMAVMRMRKRIAGLIAGLTCVALSGHAVAQERPHHLSVIAGATILDVDDSEHAFTLGLDYEYRVSERIGLGVVAERAFGPVDSTTLLATADIHLWQGLAIQTGPGVEFVDDDTAFVVRLGALYEFELGDGFTLSPQAHYDFSTAENAVVVGVAVGRAF